jgi:hypothetical protein
MNFLLPIYPINCPENTDVINSPFAVEIGSLHFLVFRRNLAELIIFTDVQESIIQLKTEPLKFVGEGAVL